MKDPMTQRPSLLLGWILAGLCLLGFFMPWARFAPESTGGNILSLANTLVGGEDDPVSSYLWMRRGEMRAALRDPADGLSGYQLALLASGRAPEEGLAGVWVQVIWHTADPGVRAASIAVLPVLALLAGILLSLGPVPFKSGLGVALGLAGSYGWMRWKMNQAYTERMLLQLDWNIGLWITLYAAALLALLLALRALLPAKVRF